MVKKKEKNMFQQDITRYEEKMKKCTSMTDLLMVMASWQSFCGKEDLTQEQKNRVDATYLEVEKRLITQVKPSLW